MNSYNIIAVAESWLNKVITDAQIALTSYNILRADHRGRVGGGVALFVHDGLQSCTLASAIPQSEEGIPEFLITEV